jgi:hypothetical protein
MEEAKRNRELIEDFLGKDHELVRTIAAPYYDSDYAWIMPVYQKITRVLYADYCEARKDQVLVTFFPPLVFSTPESTYNAVVSFLKWYKLEQIVEG